MAIDFDIGSSEYITSADSASLSITGSFTVAMWVNVESLPGVGANSAFMGRIDDADPGRGGIFFAMLNNGGTHQLRFLTNDGSSTNGLDNVTHTMTTGAWAHMVAVYNGTTFRILKDGVQLGTNTLTHNPADTSDALLFAAFTYNQVALGFYDGLMEDVRLANIAWTDEQIAQLAAGYRGPLGGEVLWFSMNEARGVAGGWDGSSLANGTNILPDISGNGNDGDPVNTPAGAASKAPRYGVAV